MKHEDRLLAALGELPTEVVSAELSARVRQAAHAALSRRSSEDEARAEPTRGPRARAPADTRFWRERMVDGLVLAFTVLHAGWAVSFVASLYH